MKIIKVKRGNRFFGRVHAQTVIMKGKDYLDRTCLEGDMFGLWWWAIDYRKEIK